MSDTTFAAGPADPGAGARWRAFLFCAGLVLIGAGVAAALGGDELDSLRRVVRFTGRTSFALFLAAFLIGPAARLRPGAATAWLLTRRRAFGLAFAFSHFVHALALWRLREFDPAAVQVSPGPALAYFAIAVMAATSFDGAVRALGWRLWSRIHQVCGWYVAISFFIVFVKRVPANGVYAAPCAILAAAMAFRFAVWLSLRRRREGERRGDPK